MTPTSWGDEDLEERGWFVLALVLVLLVAGAGLLVLFHAGGGS